MASDLLTKEQVEICSIYREEGAVAEFLEDFVEPDEDGTPFLIADHQRAAFSILWDYTFSWLLWSRRAGKTFVVSNAILAMGCLLSGIGTQVKIGLFSGSFGQVKVNFEELIRTWRRSPFIQSMTEREPRISTGVCTMRFKGWGNNEGVTIDARPLNPQKGGDTNKGFGFQILVVDEFQLLPKSVYSAIFPTMSASRNPAKRVLELRKLREQGIDRRKFDPAKNRLIFAGTASYQFMPSYQIYLMYETNMRVNKLALEVLDALEGIV